MSETAKCELCGEPMPPGETMFKFHGYSGPCPKEPLPQVASVALEVPSMDWGLALRPVLGEIGRAMQKFPTWPTDPLHGVAVLGEEFGELTKAVLQATYEPEKSSVDDVRTEAIQTAAMALRFVASLDAYRFQRCDQHSQTTL